MGTVILEMRQALRQLRLSPGFSVLAVSILGLGLGVTLYMFTVVKAYMLTPLPYPEAGRIMHVERVNVVNRSAGMPVPQHDFVDWQEAQRSFAVLAAFHEHPVILADDELASRLDGAYMTPSAFDVMQVQAHLGRTLLPADAAPGAEEVVVLGHDLWLNRYNGDPDIIGQFVRANGVPATVVGVMPAGFRFPLYHDLWLPLKTDLTGVERGEGAAVDVFGRLAPGVTLAQARSELENIAAALAERYESNRNFTIAMKPFQHEFVSAQVRGIVATMFAAVLFVLLIACANVANLILARTAARQKDIAVRSALGACRWRILVHVLTESVALAAAGALIAYGIADLLVEITERALAATGRPRPFWVDLVIDWKALAFGACAAVSAGLIAGVVPALRATRVDVNAQLKEGMKGGSASAWNLSGALVTAEIALSCILLVCSGLMIRSVIEMNAQPLAVDSRNVLTGRIGLPRTTYGDDAAVLRFFEGLVERLEAQPEVLGATAAWTYPGIDGPLMPYRTRDLEVPAEGRLPWTNYAGVMSNYAGLLGIEIVRGRWFGTQDVAGSEPVVVIDQSFAEEVFPGSDPIGQRIQFGNPDAGQTRWRTVVGVTERLLLDQLDDPHHPAAFVPLAQAPRGLLTVAVRTRGEPLAFPQTLRETVFAMDREVPVYWVRTLDHWIWAGNAMAQLIAALFGIFAIIAVVLAAAGIYGVVAYSVTQRTREIGVRRALGAANARILNTVLRGSTLQLGAGLGAGLLAAVAFARLLASELHGVSPFDPFTLSVVAVSLCAVTLVASLVPARRALRVNPMEALRHE